MHCVGYVGFLMKKRTEGREVGLPQGLYESL
jgi:hypothetical protein